MWLLFVGLYGSIGMRLYSKDQNLNQFCRIWLGEHSGSGAGPSYLDRRKEAFWRKVVVRWRQQRRNSSTEVVGMFWSESRTRTNMYPSLRQQGTLLPFIQICTSRNYFVLNVCGLCTDWCILVVDSRSRLSRLNLLLYLKKHPLAQVNACCQTRITTPLPLVH